MPLAFSTGTSSHRKNTIHQRKFKIKTVVLLHILIPGVVLSSLKTINPWLSGCDIAHPMQPDMQGTCSAATPRLSHKKMLQQVGEMLSCPKSCPLNQSSSDPQCLAYLDETRKNAICNFSSGSGSEWLKKFLGQIRLRHCCEHKIIESLSGILLEQVLKGKEECFRIIDNLVNVDNLAARVSCEFTEVLSRFDCGHSYSVRFSCEDCKEAYRRWVCSSLVPYFNGTERIRPCRSVCQVVEQKCPYFLPENRAPSLPTQYAGEPTFLCVDPNIPESVEQEVRSIYPREERCCIKPCGIPHDGICLSQGSGCDGQFAYENTTKEECNVTDTSLIRVPNEKCPGPSVHPGSKTSSVPPTSPYPFLLVLSTFLTLQASHPRSHHLLLPLLLPILLALNSPLGVLQLLACSFLAPLPPITGLVEMNASYHLIKVSKLILNYFKFNSNKWQYYFILISVNLRTGGSLLPRTPSPLSPPIRERHYRVRSEYVRGHCKRHCIQILSKSAQKLMRRKLCGLKQKNRKSLFDCSATATQATNECGGIAVKCNSSTIDRMKTCSTTILKTLTLKILHCSLNCKRRELCNAFIKRYIKMHYCRSYLNVRLLLILMNNPYIRTNVVYKIILMFLHSSKSYKYVCYYLKKYYVDKRRRKKKKKKWRVIPARVAATEGPDSAIAKI